MRLLYHVHLLFCINSTISDQGIGIPPADLPQVFDRFHRGTNVDDRHFPGMGLGLYICQGIVTEHGGSIRAESRSEQRSSFHVTLPSTFTPEQLYVNQHPRH